MPELFISQTHALGLPKAREIAQVWVAQAQADWGMTCEAKPGQIEDEIML